ncbi:hypothetical protein [Draconibacterium mangrovi]|uniref:hypothetical protein n=1 Tax=Draconibacterium mangrovi TaxID=2697469 RepID=UPI0013D01C33|nr:hypothetical protein [Draconibacterium mangrovi]
MKTQQNPIHQIITFGGKMATAIVSGLPNSKVIFKPVNKSFLQIRTKNVKFHDEKYYHRPIAKPVVEKQTLLKEKKKVKIAH